MSSFPISFVPLLSMRAKILNASAGSGKTYALAYNYVRDVVEQPMLYRHILAVTFTNKATEEMKSRILKEIHLLAAGRESDYLEALCQELELPADTVRQRAKRVRTAILHDYSHFTVLTIDKFFQRILHAFIKELGIELNYNVEIEPAPVLTRGVDALVERIAEDGELKKWMAAYSAERIEENESWDLRRDILRLGGELFKEENREALKQALPREELERMVRTAVAEKERTQRRFCQMGAEAVEIIAGEGLVHEDFTYGSNHTGGVSYFYKVAAGEIGEPKARARSCCSSEKGWLPAAKAKEHPGLIGRLQPLLNELCDYYDSHIEDWNTATLLREHYRSFALLSDLYELVRQLWREENSLLLSETKNILAAFIDRNDAPFIYEKVGNRYDRYFIDEFQDTSQREWLNFLPLLRDAMSHASQLARPDAPAEKSPAVLLVGDVKQSIYRWRGGDWRILGGEASRALGEADVEPKVSNYRSLPGIVNFNNAAIGAVVDTADGMLNTLLEQTNVGPQLKRELAGTLPRAYADHCQTPCKRGVNGGYVSVETFTEQPPLVERICEVLDRGYKPCDILILVRGATDGARAARTLLDFKRSNREPRYRFDVMTQDALLINASPLCGFLLALFHLTVDSGDTIRRAVYNRYMGRPFDAPLPEREQLLLRTLRLLPPEEAFERIVREYRLNEDRRQLAYLQALHEQVIGFTTGRVADIPLFIEWWEEHGAKRSLSVEQSLDTIEISTIHKAKGLEKKVVLIPYCSWELEPRTTGAVSNIVWAEAEGSLAGVGRVPIKFGKRMAASHFSDAFYRETVYSYVDNVNLLYVALTRAVEQLHVFIPSSRSGIGGLLWNNIVRTETEARLCCRDMEVAGRCHTLEGEEDGEMKIVGERCEFGDFAVPEPPSRKRGAEQRAVRHVLLERYPAVEPRPGLRLPTSDYRERGGEAEFSPRNFGILMHRLFEQATDAEAVFAAIGRLREQSVVSAEDARELERMVGQALALEEPHEWFYGTWDRILRERDIVLPARSGEQGRKRRPDRVMIRGRRAVVVDYKFGEKDPAAYRRQTARYMELLGEMGYEEVEGWLWYVKLGRTERVECEK